MQIVGKPPQLSARAVEQIASLATDSERGFARLRVITRLRNKLSAELRPLAEQNEAMEERSAVLRALAQGGNNMAGAALEAHEEKREPLQFNVHNLRQRIEALTSEEAEIHAWHRPANVTLEGVFKHTKVTRIEHLLPDFGFDEQVAAQ